MKTILDQQVLPELKSAPLRHNHDAHLAENVYVSDCSECAADCWEIEGVSYKDYDAPEEGLPVGGCAACWENT